jgi:DNA-binding transcriptional LysR family regulator
MIDRLNGVSLFVQAAEAGSFALAADRVGLSRSAVGKAIARLEERLGTRLFHRTTRSQSLTEAGQAYYERCRRVLAELEAAEADIDTGRAAPSGRLKVTAPVLIGRCFVAPVLLDLVRQHPGLSLEIAFTDRQADLVEDGIDLAVRAAPLPDVAGLATRRLARLPMVVCATPAYLAARGRPATLEDLPGHDLLVYGRDGRSLPWRFIEPDGHVRAMILDGRIRFDDLDSLAEATAGGLGIAMLLHWQVAGRLRDGTLVQLFTDRPDFAFDVHALWPQSRHLPSKTRAAIDALAARLPALMDAGPG